MPQQSKLDDQVALAEIAGTICCLYEGIFHHQLIHTWTILIPSLTKIHLLCCRLRKKNMISFRSKSLKRFIFIVVMVICAHQLFHFVGRWTHVPPPTTLTQQISAGINEPMIIGFKAELVPGSSWSITSQKTRYWYAELSRLQLKRWRHRDLHSSL